MKKEKDAVLRAVGTILNMFHIPWRKVMKLIEIWKKLGKQPLYITQHKDAEIFVKGLSGKYYITGIRYKNGKPLGFNAIPIDCSTCKNNVEYSQPHTCDICTSLDQEEEYGMWEAK